MVNVMTNYVSAEISQEDVADVLGHIKAIQAKLPFIIKLTIEEKRALPKMDDDRLAFVKKALNYCKNEPSICPPYVNLAEFERDLNLSSNLSQLSKEMGRLAEMISDTRIAASTDAYLAALSLYNASKQAAKMGIPGTKSIVDDLAKQFATQGNFKKEEPELTK
jgi:hypothetical protein